MNAIGDTLYLGEEFRQFKHLKSLEVSGYFRFVNNESFTNLICTNGSFELKIKQSPRVTVFEHEALRPLRKNLRVLHVESVTIGVQAALSVLKPLQGVHMEEIRLEKVPLSLKNAEFGITTGDGVITSSSTRYLRNICVRRFSLINSDVFVINGDSFTGGLFDACLKEIDLSGNAIYGSVLAIMRVLRLHHLESLTVIQHKTFHQEHSLTLNTQNLYRHYEESPVCLRRSDSHPSPTIKETNGRGKTTIFPISKSFRRLYLENNGMHSTNKLDINIKLNNSENLSALICRSFGFHKLTGHVSGVQNVKFLDLSYNDLRVLRKGFLDTFESLKELVLRQVAFDPEFMSEHSARLFKKLPDLETVDLSGNNLLLFSDQTFAQNRKLKELHLANNRFKNVPFELDLLPNLTYLDISNNAIVSLSTAEMASLDTRATSFHPIRLFLKGNVLSCSCGDLKFLYWLWTTHVDLDNNGQYQCIDKNGDISSTTAHKDLKTLWRQCVGKLYLWISLFLLTCMTSGYLLTTLILKYSNFYKACFFSFILKRLKMKRRTDYRYTAYIGYASTEYRFPFFTLRRFLEKDLGISTCVEHKDFLGTHDMATCIMEGIQSSWRTILVITDEFLSRDQWSAFIMKYAAYSLCPENPSRIVLIIEDDVRHRVPLTLLGAVSDDNIIRLPRLCMCYELRQRLKFLLQDHY